MSCMGLFSNFQLPNLPFVVHPECAFSLTYSQKWILEMSSPLLIMALLLTFVILRHIIALTATEMLVLMRFEKIPLLRRVGLFISKYGGFSVGRWWVPLVGAAGFWIYIAWEALYKKDVSKYLLWARSATTAYFGLLFFVLLFAEQLDAKYSLPRKAQREKDRLTRLHSDSPAEFVQIVSQELDRRIQQNDGKDGSSSPREQSPRASMREFLKHTESDGSNAERALLHELQELQHFDELDDEALAAAAIKLLVEPRKSNIKMRVKRILKAARDKSCFAMCNHAATFACAPAAIAIATLAALAVYHIVIAEPPNLSSNQGLGMLIVAFLCCAVILVSCLRLLFGLKSGGADTDTIVQDLGRTDTSGSNVQMLQFVGMNARKRRTPEPEPDSVMEFELLPVQDRNAKTEKRPTELTVAFDGELRLVRSNTSVLIVHHANGMHFDMATWPILTARNALFDEEELANQYADAETIFVVIDKDDRDAGFACSEDLIVRSATGRRVIECAVTQGMRLTGFNGRQLTESTWMDVKNLYQITPRPWVFEFRPEHHTATANPLAQDALPEAAVSTSSPSSSGGPVAVTFDDLRPGLTLISIDGTDVELLEFAELAKLLQGGHPHVFLFSLLRRPSSQKGRRQRRRQKIAAAATAAPKGRIMVGMDGLNADVERTARDTFIEILCWCEDEKPFHSEDPDVGTALRKIIYFISLFLVSSTRLFSLPILLGLLSVCFS